MQLLGAGVENDFVHALVMFCLQYVFVNHEFWKYKVKQDRWNVTLKVCTFCLSVFKVLNCDSIFLYSPCQCSFCSKKANILFSLELVVANIGSNT